MSSEKNRNTKKIQEDENTDSGFLSGPLNEHLFSEELDVDSDSKNVVSDSEDPYQLDSGVDLCISECLSNVKLSESTPTAQLLPPLITVEEDKSQDIPPLDVLFQQDEDGDTQLHISAVHGCQKSVGTLIRVCPEKEWLNVRNDYGQTALHLAVLSGHAVVARMLVVAGASLAARDLSGQTPLHIATAHKKLECLQALLAPVPEHMPRKISSILNQKDYDGQTCVHIAATTGYLEALKTLVFYGADITAREGLAGWTALHIAARRGDCDTARYIVERWRAAPAARDYAGRRARRLARHTPAANLFLDSFDDSDTDDSDDEVDSDSESLFEKIRETMNPINVA